MCGLLTVVAPPVAEHGLYAGHRLQYLRLVSLVAPQYLEPSQTRYWPCVPCTGRRILNYWATREVRITVFIDIFQGNSEVLFLWAFVVFLRSNRTWVLWTKRTTLPRDGLCMGFMCVWTFMLMQRFLKALVCWQPGSCSHCCHFPSDGGKYGFTWPLLSRPSCILFLWDIS